MSDNLYPETPWYHNIGLTLPSETSATHNIGFSPLFMERSGEIYIDSSDIKLALTARGQEGILQAANDKGLLLLLFNTTNVEPSRTLNGVRVFSLRCLVSTTNS